MKIDHIAIRVDDIERGIEWHNTHFDANCLYFDESWAILEFDNTKLALTLANTHPPHVAIAVDRQKWPNLEFKQHRDGSNYHYLQDPWGNCVELIDYGCNTSENP